MNLEKYRNYISRLVEDDLTTNLNFQIGKIKESTKYALEGGKNLRSIIVLTICNSLNKMTKQNLSATRAALALEYIHNASLIIDDLPMMDNDLVRRGRKSLHHEYSEKVAQLVSYNLIVTSVRHLSENLDSLSKANFMNEQLIREISKIVYGEFNDRLSLNGLCGGQYMDLHINEEFKNLSKEEKQERILDLIIKKTSSLFELSFMMGWVFGGGIVEKVPEMLQIGKALGIAFQIVDDLQDREQDFEKENHNNICEYYNTKELRNLFIQNMKHYREGLEELGIFTPALREIYNLLVDKFQC